MVTPTTNRFQMVAVAATATVVFFALELNESIFNLSKIHDIGASNNNKILWDEYARTSHYTIARTDIQDINQIMTIHKFASHLLEKSENLDPSIAKIINRNFSKLL